MLQLVLVLVLCIAEIASSENVHELHDFSWLVALLSPTTTARALIKAGELLKPRSQGERVIFGGHPFIVTVKTALLCPTFSFKFHLLSHRSYLPLFRPAHRQL